MAGAVNDSTINIVVVIIIIIIIKRWLTNSRSHGGGARHVVHDADFAERLARRHGVEHGGAIFRHNLNRSVVDEKYGVGKIVLADDVFVAQIVSGVQQTRQRANYHRVGVTKQSDSTTATHSRK